MTKDEVARLKEEREKTLVKLQEVRTAIKTLCFLYPEAGGRGQPKCAGVVLRRFFLRERDMISVLNYYDGELKARAEKGG